MNQTETETQTLQVPDSWFAMPACNASSRADHEAGMQDQGRALMKDKVEILYRLTSCIYPCSL